MNLKSVLPILDWLPNYQKLWFKGDLAAGLTVGVMLIPQGIAYAMIAGLPPIYGLYTAMIPQLVYAIFGTSRQLAVGPVAMDSLIVASGVGAIAAVGSEYFIFLAILLALIMGAIQVLFGIFRLGFLVNFLSTLHVDIKYIVVYMYIIYIHYIYIYICTCICGHIYTVYYIYIYFWIKWVQVDLN